MLVITLISYEEQKTRMEKREKYPGTINIVYTNLHINS